MVFQHLGGFTIKHSIIHQCIYTCMCEELLICYWWWCVVPLRVLCNCQTVKTFSSPTLFTLAVNELDLTFKLRLSMQHPQDSHEPQKTKQESRGEWLPLCARPQGIHSPRLFGTKKAKKSATRDLRYDAELLTKKLSTLHEHWLLLIPENVLFWNVLNKPQQRFKALWSDFTKQWCLQKRSHRWLLLLVSVCFLFVILT